MPSPPDAWSNAPPAALLSIQTHAHSGLRRVFAAAVVRDLEVNHFALSRQSRLRTGARSNHRSWRGLGRTMQSDLQPRAAKSFTSRCLLEQSLLFDQSR